jgi:DNA polymerase-3 subunit alpha
VNLSSYEFAVVDDRTIRYGLGAIKGVGQGAVESIVAERRAHGDFSTLEDFCRRLDLSKINRRVLEALIKSGSLDGLATNRATLMHRLDAALALGEQNSKANETGQHDIFGLSAAHVPEAVRATAPDQPEWTDSVASACRARNARARNLRTSDRPIRERSCRASSPAASSTTSTPRSLRPAPMAGRAFFGGKPVAIAGVVEELRKRGPRTEVVLDDDSGASRWDSFDETFQQYREILVKDALLLIEGKLRFDEFANTWVLRANKVSELERLREKEARRIVLKVRTADALSLDKLQGPALAASRWRLPGRRAVLCPGCPRHVVFRPGLECQANPGPDRRSREAAGSWTHRRALQPTAREYGRDFHQRLVRKKLHVRRRLGGVSDVGRQALTVLFSRPYGSEFPRFRAADRRT